MRLPAHMTAQFWNVKSRRITRYLWNWVFCFEMRFWLCHLDSIQPESAVIRTHGSIERFVSGEGDETLVPYSHVFTIWLRLAKNGDGRTNTAPVWRCLVGKCSVTVMMWACPTLCYPSSIIPYFKWWQHALKISLWSWRCRQSKTCNDSQSFLPRQDADSRNAFLTPKMSSARVCS